MQLRKSTKVLVRTAIAARDKVSSCSRFCRRRSILLLKQQEIAVELLQAKRLAEVDCDGSISHGSCASFSSPLSPQQWALGLAASLPEDARIKFEECCTNVNFEAKASVDPLFGGLEPGVSSDSTASGSCFVDTIATTSAGSNFRAGLEGRHVAAHKVHAGNEAGGSAGGGWSQAIHRS